MMLHIEDFRPVQNLASLADLVAALGAATKPSRQEMARWQELATGRAS